MIPTLQQGQFGRRRVAAAGAAVAYKIEMDLEGANGSQTFTDTGTGGSTWTGTGGATLTTTSPLAGSSSLVLAGTSDYMEAAASTAANMLPATNDFDLSFTWRPATIVSSSYVVSVMDTTASAAGTQFSISLGSFSEIYLYGSNGTTRSLLAGSGSTAVASNTTYAMLLSRRGTAIAISRDGVSIASGTLAGGYSFAQPAGRKFRWGKPEYPGEVGQPGRFDTIRLRVYP